MDVSFLEEAFPTQLKIYMADYQKRADEKYDLVVAERDQARERAKKAEEERDKIVEERDRIIQKFKERLLEQVSKKRESQSRQTLIAKIQSVKSLDALLDIQSLLQRFKNLEEIERNLVQ